MQKLSHILLTTAFLLFARVGAAAPGLEPGLAFKSYETEPDGRTSLSLEQIPLIDSLSLSFDLKIESGREAFGYVCRILLDDEPFLDILLSNPVHQQPYIATAEAGGDLMPFLDYRQIYQWNTVSLNIRHRKDGTALCLANGKKVASAPLNPHGRHCISFFFGANSLRGISTTDVAPMTLRNLSLSRKPKTLGHWSLLSEAELHRKDGRIRLRAVNAAWLTDSHRYWNEIASFHSPDMFFIADDPARGRVYFINGNRVIDFELDDGDSEVYPFAQTIKKDVLTNDFQVLDDGSLAYVDFDQEDPVRSVFDFEKSEWTGGDITRRRHSRFSHHNSFLNPLDGQLVQLFGYGFHAYLGKLFRYSPDGVRSVQDTGIPPRYLSAVGLSDSCAFILGGKGNPKGQQELGIGTYDDIWRLSLSDYTVSRVGSFQNPEALVPAQKLMICGLDTAVALFFNPNTRKSELQLKRVCLRDGTSEDLADPIPYTFQDTESYATLTWTGNALYAMLNHRDGTDSFVAKIYRLELPAFVPPVEEESHQPRLLLPALGFLALCASTFGAMRSLRRRRKHPADKRIDDFEIVPYTPAPGIHLLGGFHVIDKDGEDISASFSPMMKQLLSLLVLYTARSKGISNAEMKDILWGDKSEESYFNNRGVMFKKIRKALASVSPRIGIVSESGYWSIRVTEDLCDYISALGHLSPGSDARALISDAQSGPLLPEMRYEWLDKFKAEYADKVILALSELNSSGRLGPEAQLKVSDAILSFDSIDEDAVRTKCRTLIQLKRAGTARSEFDRFTGQYFSLLGESYGKSFTEFLNG